MIMFECEYLPVIIQANNPSTLYLFHNEIISILVVPKIKETVPAEKQMHTLVPLQDLLPTQQKQTHRSRKLFR